MIVSLPIAIVYMGSYYAKNMTHVTYVLMIMNIDVFIYKVWIWIRDGNGCFYVRSASTSIAFFSFRNEWEK
jgi:hypothetical protein